jgi:hypothetical protein
MLLKEECAGKRRRRTQNTFTVHRQAWVTDAVASTYHGSCICIGAYCIATLVTQYAHRPTLRLPRSIVQLENLPHWESYFAMGHRIRPPLTLLQSMVDLLRLCTAYLCIHNSWPNCATCRSDIVDIISFYKYTITAASQDPCSP